MELLLLDVKAPSTSGYLELTIDAIKYIDGTAIKDVKLDGDKTIKAGIGYTYPPSANLDNLSVSTTSISFDAVIKDDFGVIGDSEINVYLSNGSKLIAQREIEVGTTSISFNDLLMGTTYEIGIGSSYDLIDGNGLKAQWMLIKAISTQKSYTITDATVTKTSVEFVVEKTGSYGELTKIELVDSVEDKVVQTLTDTTLRSFANLLSNHKYKIVLNYKYSSGGSEVFETSAISFTTKEKVKPKVEIVNAVVTDTSIIGDLTVSDDDNICVINFVKLYKGKTLASTNSQNKISFTGLEYYTDYKVVVSYSYNLNDGTNTQTFEISQDYKTTPHIKFNSCKIINTSAVSEGETIFMQVSIDNASGAIPKSVVVNGETYNCSGSTTANKIFLEIVNNGQFEGGNTLLEIEKIKMALDGKEYDIYPNGNNSESVFINGSLEILSVDFAAKERNSYVKRAYLFPTETPYVMLTLSNKTGYKIDKVYASSYWEEDKYYTNLIKVSNDVWVLEYDLNNRGVSDDDLRFHISELTYSNQYITKTISLDDDSSVLFLKNDEVVKVSTPNDLLNMNEGMYYELTNDIDLSNMEWRGGNFMGVLNGNGYTIKNMSYVGTIKNSEAYVGLFKSAHGYIENLNISNAMLIVDHVNNSGDKFYRVACGAIAGYATTLTINNCSVDSESFIRLNSNSEESYQSAGGFVGCANSLYINNSSNLAAVSGVNVGGFGGEVFGGKITSSYNKGFMSGEYSAGGIVGKATDITIIDSYNTGDVSSDFYVGGIIGRILTGKIMNCYNVGSIAGNLNAGGIVGCWEYDYIGTYNLTLLNCLNAGEVSNSDSYIYQKRLVGNYQAGNTAMINALNLNNCYNLNCGITVSDLNDREFYLKQLNWSDSVWNFNSLDFENKKYPKLK